MLSKPYPSLFTAVIFTIIYHRKYLPLLTVIDQNYLQLFTIINCSCDRSIYHALGNGTFHYLKAVMTFDQVFFIVFKNYFRPRVCHRVLSPMCFKYFSHQHSYLNQPSLIWNPTDGSGIEFRQRTQTKPMISKTRCHQQHYPLSDHRNNDHHQQH